MIVLEWGGHVLRGDVDRVAGTLVSARSVVALTGAGVSVESGIPDFRSPGGLWETFDPFDHGTLRCFERTPERSWELFRALGATLRDRRPNGAHRALARLESIGVMRAIVTQNVDGLHQAAGSRDVVEIHGDHRSLECLRCGSRRPVTAGDLRPGPVPRCASCTAALKPAVVLFEEPVRHLERVDGLLAGCDVLVVAGTSAEVAPASEFPGRVLARGGSVIELNVASGHLTARGLGADGALVLGPVARTLPVLTDRVALVRARGA